jgi:hypothetical protein
MGYLTIKQVNKDKITIQSSKQYISLSYKLDYITLSSISIQLNNVKIRENNGYYIMIHDTQSVKMLSILDEYLSQNIHNYKRLVHLDGKEHYLYLKQNNYLDEYMNELTDDTIIINIIKLKKTASHTFPIVYVL